MLVPVLTAMLVLHSGLGVQSRSGVYEPLWASNNTQELTLVKRSKTANQIPSKLSFGVDSGAFEREINRIYLDTCAPELSPVPGISVQQVAAKIKVIVSQSVKRLGSRLTNLGQDWLLAEGIGAWVRIYVKDWPEIRQPGKVRPEYIDSKFMLAMETPKGVCSGFSVMVRDIARASGLACFSVIGVTRGDLGVSLDPQMRDNHEWVYFKFAKDLWVPMDTANTRVSSESVIKASGKRYRDLVLPKTPQELELFMATRFARNSRDDVSASDFELNGIDFGSWCQMSTSQLQPILQDLRSGEVRFNRK